MTDARPVTPSAPHRLVVEFDDETDLDDLERLLAPPSGLDWLVVRQDGVTRAEVVVEAPSLADAVRIVRADLESLGFADAVVLRPTDGPTPDAPGSLP